MSIRWLLAFVGFLAVGCVAAKHATPLWMVGTVTATVAVLIFFTVQALTRTERAKLFAQGFSVAGWLYVLLLMLGVEHTLATTWASQAGYQLVSREDEPNLTYHGAWFRAEGDRILFSREADGAGSGAGQRRRRGGGGGYGAAGYGSGGYGGYGGGYGQGYDGGYGGGDGGYGGGYGGGYAAASAPRNLPVLTPYARYMHVTHCMWTMVVACLFGVVAARGNHRGTSQPARPAA